jgi:hypothetical protein
VTDLGVRDGVGWSRIAIGPLVVAIVMVARGVSRSAAGGEADDRGACENEPDVHGVTPCM